MTGLGEPGFFTGDVIWGEWKHDPAVSGCYRSGARQEKIANGSGYVTIAWEMWTQTRQPCVCDEGGVADSAAVQP